MDREDAKHLITTCVAESEVDVKATRFPKAEVLGDIFSLAVNTHKTIPEVLRDHYDYFEHLAPQIADIQQRYAARKRATNAMDFDDLLVLWLKLMQEQRGGARAVPAALPVHPGGRIPGHQQAAERPD